MSKVDLAQNFNDHMARLLQHADSLLEEWEKAAKKSGETLGKQMRAAVAEASPAIVEELRKNLAESVRQDLRRMQPVGGGGRAWLLPALVVSNVAIAIGLVFALMRSPTQVAATPLPHATPSAAATPASAPAPAPNGASPAPSPSPSPVAALPVAAPAAPLCEGLLRGGHPDAREVAAQCAKLTCGRDEARCDASLAVATRAPKPRCKPKGDAAHGYAVDEPWLRECLKGR